MNHASPSVGPRLPCLRCSSAAQSGFDRLSWARCAEATREDVAVVSKSVGRWLSVFNTRVVWLCDWRKHLRLTNERPDSQPCYWCWHQFSPGFFFFFFFHTSQTTELFLCRTGRTDYVFLYFCLWWLLFFFCLCRTPTCFSFISSFLLKRNLAHHCDKRDEWGTERSNVKCNPLKSTLNFEWERPGSF